MKQQYDSYKPSGIDWIGDIPSHWVSKRLRYVCEFRNGYTPSKANGDYWSEGTIPWYRMEDIRESGRFLKESKQYVSTEAVKGGGLFEAGSFILATTATIGEHAMLIVDSLANQQFTNLKIRKSLSHTVTKEFFFYYLFVIDEFCKSTTKTTTFPAMDMTDLRNFGVSIPPLSEQEAIAAWLDEKCGEIDAAIAKVDREIELIDELKQSEISRVVTRGLNPDAPLRPSGIDWIGDIPSHWVSKRLRYVCEFRNGYTPSKANDDYWTEGTIPWYRMEDIRESGRFLKESKQYVSTEAVKGGGLFEAGSFILATTATIGEHAMLIVDSLANQQFTNLKIRKSLSHTVTKEFFFYYLFVIDEFCKSTTKTTTFPAMDMTDLRNFGVSIPPLSEQEAIADYLDKKCAEIDGLKAKLGKKRETLTELRQSIISEVVTGKRKVI